MLPVTDAAVLATKASGAIIVVRHGKTKRDHLRRSVEALDAVGGNLLGCILNRTPKRGPESQNYSGDYYRYGGSRRGRRRAAASANSVPAAMPERFTAASPKPAPHGAPAPNGMPATNGVPAATGILHPGYAPEPAETRRSSTVLPDN
jgi:Mrp family chromosome partitioning ATPase